MLSRIKPALLHRLGRAGASYAFLGAGVVASAVVVVSLLTWIPNGDKAIAYPVEVVKRIIPRVLEQADGPVASILGVDEETVRNARESLTEPIALIPRLAAQPYAIASGEVPLVQIADSETPAPRIIPTFDATPTDPEEPSTGTSEPSSTPAASEPTSSPAAAPSAASEPESPATSEPSPSTEEPAPPTTSEPSPPAEEPPPSATEAPPPATEEPAPPAEEPPPPVTEEQPPPVEEPPPPTSGESPPPDAGPPPDTETPPPTEEPPLTKEEPIPAKTSGSFPAKT